MFAHFKYTTANQLYKEVAVSFNFGNKKNIYFDYFTKAEKILL